MHILHVNDIANVGATLVDGLAALGHQAELRRLRLVAGQRSTAVKLLAAPLRLQELGAVNHQVRRGRYDIVHIHFAYLGWLGILGRYPYILHCHGSDVRRDLHDPLRRWPILQSLKRARRVLVSTPDLLDIVQPFRPDAHFLPNPIHTENFQPDPLKESHRARILLISRLDSIKGIDIAFQAIAHLHAAAPDIEVTAIAAGPEYPRYAHVAGVRFIPPVAYAEMPALLNAHDIIVGQFAFGVLGMSELESLACGKPVICHSAYAEVYPDPPPVFASRDPAAIAGQILTWVAHPAAMAEIGAQGRAWAIKYHDYLSVSRQLETLYAEAK